MFSESRKPKTLHQILSQYCTPYDALVEDFTRCARLISVKKGQPVVRQGEISNHFVFNRVGLFRVSHINGNTEDTVLFGSSGDVFTSLHSYYAGEPAIFTLSAVEDSEAWLISYDDMRMLEEKHPILTKWMNRLLTEHSESLRRTSVKYISRIVPLKYIAQYLNINQSTLSRIRKRILARKDQ